ncbi:hypothetical protein [Rhodococcus sp. IEGM 1305]|nr:hypothetical protein [Rhodococcus sp. IEGM 1305]MDI9953040.1 hypothetical protein [Rhodococcus sp. IEGM 1305]
MTSWTAPALDHRVLGHTTALLLEACEPGTLAHCRDAPPVSTY